MKNLYAEPKSHQTLAYGLGILPATIVLIVFYLLKLLVKILNKFKVQLWKASLMGGVVFFLTAFFMPVVYSPYANASEPQHQLAPLSEREANIALIRKIWGKDSDTGLAIAKCESGYRTNAENHNTNGTVDEGIFQINSIHTMPEMFNAVANISYAYSMYLTQGTTPWNSSSKCWK